VFWTCILVVVLSICTWQISLLLHKYRSYPVNVVIKVCVFKSSCLCSMGNLLYRRREPSDQNTSWFIPKKTLSIAASCSEKPMRYRELKFWYNLIKASELSWDRTKINWKQPQKIENSVTTLEALRRDWFLICLCWWFLSWSRYGFCSISKMMGSLNLGPSCQRSNTTPDMWNETYKPCDSNVYNLVGFPAEWNQALDSVSGEPTNHCNVLPPTLATHARLFALV
jgi:hypothetical protein